MNATPALSRSTEPRQLPMPEHRPDRPDTAAPSFADAFDRHQGRDALRRPPVQRLGDVDRPASTDHEVQPRRDERVARPPVDRSEARIDQAKPNGPARPTRSTLPNGGDHVDDHVDDTGAKTDSDTDIGTDTAHERRPADATTSLATLDAPPASMTALVAAAVAVASTTPADAVTPSADNAESTPGVAASEAATSVDTVQHPTTTTAHTAPNMTANTTAVVSPNGPPATGDDAVVVPVVVPDVVADGEQPADQVGSPAIGADNPESKSTSTTESPSRSIPGSTAALTTQRTTSSPATDVPTDTTPVAKLDRPATSSTSSTETESPATITDRPPIAATDEASAEGPDQGSANRRQATTPAGGGVPASGDGDATQASPAVPQSGAERGADQTADDATDIGPDLLAETTESPAEIPNDSPDVAAGIRAPDRAAAVATGRPLGAVPAPSVAAAHRAAAQTEANDLLARAELNRVLGGQLEADIDLGDLGRVRVGAVDRGQGLELQLRSDQSAVRSALIETLDELRTELRDHGHDIDRVNVDTLGGRGQQSRRDGGPSERLPVGRPPVTAATAGVEPAAGRPTARHTLSASADGLDLRL